MATGRNDGGPAFPYSALDPRVLSAEHMTQHPGLSLRDYFAAQALAGWGEGFHAVAYELFGKRPNSAEIAEIAKTCFYMADAMLAERAK